LLFNCWRRSVFEHYDWCCFVLALGYFPLYPFIQFICSSFTVIHVKSAWDNPNIFGRSWKRIRTRPWTLFVFFRRKAFIASNNQTTCNTFLCNWRCVYCNMIIAMAWALLRSYSRGAWFATSCGIVFYVAMSAEWMDKNNSYMKRNALQGVWVLLFWARHIFESLTHRC